MPFEVPALHPIEVPGDRAPLFLVGGDGLRRNLDLLDVEVFREEDDADRACKLLQGLVRVGRETPEIDVPWHDQLNHLNLEWDSA